MLSRHNLYGGGENLREGQIFGLGAGIDRLFNLDGLSPILVRGNDRSTFENPAV